MEKIKALIPAAGLGTRFLPATKNMPKEMLPIINKPAIHYIVEEGIRSGINDFVIVTNKTKNIIEDYFDTSLELETFLHLKNKSSLIAPVNALLQKARFIYVRQKKPLGLGNAVFSAKHVIENHHVAIFLPDDIMVSQVPAMQQLIKVARQEKCNVIAIEEVPMEHISNYGVIAIRKQFSPNLFQVKEVVEKPSARTAPSNLAIIGRYVLSPKIFHELQNTQAGSGGEIQLTDAIETLLQSGEKVFAYKTNALRYDVGTPLGLIKANIDFAIKNASLSKDILTYLNKLEKDMLMLQEQIKKFEEKQHTT
jgi:UTP--glucose-1-phosphate uridylyltransferase